VPRTLDFPFPPRAAYSSLPRGCFSAAHPNAVSELLCFIILPTSPPLHRVSFIRFFVDPPLVGPITFGEDPSTDRLSYPDLYPGSVSPADVPCQRPQGSRASSFRRVFLEVLLFACSFSGSSSLIRVAHACQVYLPRVPSRFGYFFLGPGTSHWRR